jgi:hypothetical protein
MADPLSIGLMIAGTAAAVGGTIYSANAAKQQAGYDASVSEGNAARADVTAEQIVAENARQEVDFRRDYTDFSKSQEVARTKSGVYAYSGTPLQVAMESGRNADDEIQRRRYNAEQGFRDTQDRAAGFRANAVNLRIGGRARQTAGYIQAGKSLMSGSERVSRYI